MNRQTKAVIIAWVVSSTVATAAPARHEDNPIGKPVGTVSSAGFYYPRLGERVSLGALTLQGANGVSLSLGSAVCTVRMRALNSTQQRPLDPAWQPANGATLYRTLIFQLDRPLRVGTVFNNNPDHSVDDRAWSWITVGSGGVTTVAVCYTSRGMVVTPGMPTKNMKPATY